MKANKMFKKIVCAALAATTVVGGAVAFAGCTTNHPEVEMQIEFNGVTYTLEYKLYRKKATNTVNHFLALAENGYYDGLCVHDYTAAKWYTGAYSFDETTDVDGGLVYKDYFKTVSAYENKDFVSVWKDSDKTIPTYTLYGEFSDNGMTIAKGDFLAQSFGSLSMIYEDKGADAEEYKVYVNRLDGKGVSAKDYEMNSATSMFAINITGAGVDKKHATFATLEEDSVDELTALKDAIAAYISANYPDDEEGAPTFTNETTIHYGQNDPIIEDLELSVEYEVPSEPIVIKSVKVTKY